MRCVVVPDYQGQEASHGTLSRAVSAVLPDAVTVAAVNGVDVLSATAPEVDVCFASPGFNRPVLAGLSRALDIGADEIARVDDNEHPMDLLPYAFDQLDAADVVVLDTAFDAATLTPGSGEEYHTRWVIPETIRAATDGRLALSGAHGFMAFRASALAVVLPVALSALSRAEDAARRLHRPDVIWSVDGLLVVIAVRQGLRVAVHPRRATAQRANPPEKSVAQLRDLLALVRALDTLA